MSEETVITPATTPDEIEAARIAELDKVYAEQQKADAELREKYEKEQKLLAENAELKLKDAVSAARKESGFSFYSPTPELIKLVRNEPGFLVNALEQSYFVDGQRVELVDLLRAYAERHKWSREYTQAERAAHRGQKESGVKSKADLRTSAEKSAFVSKYGADAYAALPLNTPIDDSKIPYLTLEEFSKLPTRQKVRFVAKNGQQAVENLRVNKR